MDITSQKAVAKSFLEILGSVDKTVTLSGGAPRNWERNLPANDLDFYVSVSPEEVASVLGEGFKNFITIIGLEFNEIYDLNPFLKSVLTNENYNGCKIQIMFVQNISPENVTKNFPVSCSQIWYDKDFNLHKTKLYEVTEEDKVVVQVGHLYAARGKYIEKIRSYYPERAFFEEVVVYNRWRVANGKDSV